MSFPLRPEAGLSVEKLAWFSGIWKGRVGEDDVEEAWTEPQNGSLMGMFRWFRGGNLRLMEMITVGEFDGEIRLKIKHFDAALHSWEAQDETTDFVLVQLGSGIASFLEVGKEQWLIYKREEQRLTVWFERNDGPPSVALPFEYNLTSTATS